jgi:hypothetical protein
VRVEVEPFAPERGALLRGALLAMVLIAATALGVLVAARPTLYAYLLAFAYWGGIALGALVLLMIFHATRARWPVVVRRPLEAIASTVTLFALLFVPVALGMRELYAWVAPPGDLGREALALLAHKRPYLNVPFFLVRTGVYFAVAIFVAHRLFRWSNEQDGSGALDLSRRAHALGTGGLPLMALVFAFAAFDWLMSLTPLWYSTIFGVYVFAGSFVGAVALLILFVTLGRGAAFARLATAEHLHNLGKLLFAFTCFWAYIAFAQLLLIWIANLPEEIPFFLVRMRGAWGWVGVVLVLTHFVVPFSALLSRSLKRSRRGLALAAAWMLGAHFVDLYWVVIPTLAPEGLWFSWTVLTSFFGVGAAAVTFALWRLRGRFPIPVRDPYLPQSLTYRQP